MNFGLSLLFGSVDLSSYAIGLSNLSYLFWLKSRAVCHREASAPASDVIASLLLSTGPVVFDLRRVLAVPRYSSVPSLSSRFSHSERIKESLKNAVNYVFFVLFDAFIGTY